MKLVKNIPGFLTEFQWNDHRNSFRTLNPQSLFPDSNLFAIPQGTLVERFSYGGMELTRFVYPFSFFSLMDQYTKSLTSNRFEMGTEWYCYENVSDMVKIGCKFVIEVVKKYRGDFKSDTTLRRLIQHLEILSTQMSASSGKHFDFCKLYFELNYVLISKKLLNFSEAFTPLIQKKFFPQALTYNKVNKQLFFSQINNGSILIRNLKTEENSNDHSFLILYLKLIEDMVEVSI